MSNKIIYRFLLIAVLFLTGCSKPLVAELTKEEFSYDETIHLNNCNNQAESTQNITHSFSTKIVGSGSINPGSDMVLVESTISAAYEQYSSISKTQIISAAPNTNMVFTLSWSEDVRSGNVTVNGQTINYKVHIPISVDQKSSQNLGCETGDISAPTINETQVTSTQNSVIATQPVSTDINSASAGKLLFSENLDDGYADGFTFQSGGWKVVDDNTGNKVLEMTSTTCCANGLFGPSNISDGIVELRYKVISADYQAQHHVATVGFRLKTSTGNFTSYALIYEPDGFGLRLIYQENGGEWQPVERSSGGGSIQTQEGSWITLRVEFQGNNIKVFVNGEPFITAQDSRAKEGALILGANGVVTVQFDDIKVWEFSK